MLIHRDWLNNSSKFQKSFIWCQKQWEKNRFLRFKSSSAWSTTWLLPARCYLQASGNRWISLKVTSSILINFNSIWERKLSSVMSVFLQIFKRKALNLYKKIILITGAFNVWPFDLSLIKIKATHRFQVCLQRFRSSQPADLKGGSHFQQQHNKSN